MNDYVPSNKYYGKFRPRRSLVLAFGVMLGVFITLTAQTVVREIRAAQPKTYTWNDTALRFVGFQDGRYFIENTTAHDYQLDPAHVVILERRQLGLVPSDIRLVEPVFVPAGESAGLLLEPLPSTDIVLFDVRRKYRVTLRGGDHDA